MPFAVESSLSGVMKDVGEKNELWYTTTFDVPGNWKKEDVLLHFGAVDWRADVWLNGIKIGSHEGGYDPFSFNISPFLNGKNQELTIRVWDPTNNAQQPEENSRTIRKVFFTHLLPESGKRFGLSR